MSPTVGGVGAAFDEIPCLKDPQDRADRLVADRLCVGQPIATWYDSSGRGRNLGQEDAFMFRMVEAVRDEMQGAYPELVESAGRVAKVVRAEEERFGRTLALGRRRLPRPASSRCTT